MDLSIIIVNWNTKGLLADCLQTVVDNLQDLHAEIIVVDNGSTDGSPDMVAQRFPQARLVENTENRGFAAANNQAISLAEGQYILLLNSDTLVHGDVLAKSVEYMQQNPQVAVMGCRVLNSDGSVQLTCSQFPTLLNLFFQTSGLWKLPWPRFFSNYQMPYWQRDDEREVEVVSGCYMLVRASTLPTVGLLDESFFFFGEETDWCHRFKKAGWRLSFAPVGEITHYHSASARKLHYKRDLMLTYALILLQRKHGGAVHAFFAWLILLVFNSTRAALWSLRALWSSNPAVTERRNHFISITRNFHRTWPWNRASLRW